MQLPHTISNIHGEKITFLRIITNENGEEILELENEVQPKAGPPMHVHYKQDECLTVTEGRIGYQVLGGEKKAVVNIVKQFLHSCNQECKIY